jgi:hypothetical protein
MNKGNIRDIRRDTEQGTKKVRRKAVSCIMRHCPINCVNEKLQGSVPVVFFFSNPSFFFERGFEKKKHD